jgi:GNAT superfamily N-acetyltransferase
MSGWPEHLRPGAVRFARVSARYDETIAFYREVVGLPVVGEFAGSFGEDGVIFGLPDTTVELEIVRAQEGDADVARLDDVVLYLDGADAVVAATAPLRAAGLTPDPSPHPYWAANGAVVFRDPDGRGVVFAPWVYGRALSPNDPVPRLEWYDGDREAIRHLFEEAESSREQLDSYFWLGRVLVAWAADRPVAHLQLVDIDRAIVELKNMAVLAEFRRTGLGRRLVDEAVRDSTSRGFTRMTVSTGAADSGNLRFYQRCGFRMTSVEPDAFTPATGYPEPILIEGVELRDRVWFAMDLS